MINRRRTAAAILAACVSGAAGASAQPPTAAPDAQRLPEPAREATPAPNPWTFPGDAGLMIIFVRPDKTADFEAVLARAKETLLNSDKAARREQAAGWKVFKARETAAGAVIYVSVMDPIVKDADYSLGSLLGEETAGDADPKTSIYAKYLQSFSPQAINLLHLAAVADFSR
ncbi:MAG TPA: hypothetical protein VKH42_08955 [Vicinamibacterales bacterium]|nr:hypothetical protein [Vicinamibacterales bacterium]